MFYVYLLLCSDSTIYTGITRDVNERLERHRQGSGSRHTAQRKVLKILYTESFKTKSEAAQRERQIKGWRREKKLNLIKFGKPVNAVVAQLVEQLHGKE